MFSVFGGRPHLPNSLLSSNTQPNLSPLADTKNASTWTCFWCPQAFLSSKTRNMPLWACFWFSLAPFPFPSCGQQKCVHMDAFLLSAGSPPLEKQKHAHGGVFLLFVGSPPFPTMPTPETRPQGRVLMLAGSSHIPHLSPLPPPTILIRFRSELLRIQSELLGTAWFQLVPTGSDQNWWGIVKYCL